MSMRVVTPHLALHYLHILRLLILYAYQSIAKCVTVWHCWRQRSACILLLHRYESRTRSGRSLRDRVPFYLNISSDRYPEHCIEQGSPRELMQEKSVRCRAAHAATSGVARSLSPTTTVFKALDPSTTVFRRKPTPILV